MAALGKKKPKPQPVVTKDEAHYRRVDLIAETRHHAADLSRDERLLMLLQAEILEVLMERSQ